ncbi:protein-lysine 6-oxidase [Streptomyces sp. HC44]|uniref:Protein-lysine 6-oxidase n=2 Tax=Streptomyces scabichelini TaxID=2711217 RepID=A0A6G4VHL3_9ACTN|nr:protein-lysine 6-oxidase [Streptomyces scabichelini]
MTRQQHRNRPKRAALAAGFALTTVVAGAGAAPGAGAAEAGTAGKPKLKLIAATDSLTLDRWEEEGGVTLDLGTYVTVDGAPLEFKVTRKSYKDPVVAQQIIHEGTKTKAKKLPAGLVKDFAGLPGFLEVSVKNAAGEEVSKTEQAFCPNNASGRIRPDAPATSKYPQGCSTNPFTLGSVWGVEKGWASNTTSWYGSQVDLPAGEYTANVAVAKKYRDLFGIPDDRPTIKLTVRENSFPDGEGVAASRSSAHSGGHQAAGHDADASPHQGPGGADEPAPPAVSHALEDRGVAPRPGDGPGYTDGSPIAPESAPASAAKPHAERPTGRAGVAANVPKPDLRSLPAWGIEVTDGEEGDDGDHGGVAGKDYLAFSANVWNAGPAPLVVDGFRSPGKNLMDAYQYFYDADGKEVGYAPTGTMEWDERDGHDHWHFTDFASYRLLSEDQTKEVRSGKEAFCLANTDAIDYTVKNANWHPENTDLSTACGGKDAISVREVLDVGSGDTYGQYLPGQSFDITDLANGTYYIQVIANPEKRLQETNTGNNVALRKVIIGGEPGARTVTVPPHDLIDAP